MEAQFIYGNYRYLRIYMHRRCFMVPYYLVKEKSGHKKGKIRDCHF